MTTIGVTPPAIHARFGKQLVAGSEEYNRYAKEFELPEDTFISVANTPKESL